MSRLSEVLREYRAALDTVHERRARSRRASKEHETLDLLEEVIPEVAKALLEDLGEPISVEATADETISKASTAVGGHRDRFANDAPVQFFAQRIEGLKQVLRDIEYLRQGFGLGSGRPQPADMKWTHVGAVESYVLDITRYVANELKSDGAEVYRLRPEVELDLGAAHRGIVEMLGRDLGPNDFMDAVIALAERLTNSAGWDAYRDILYERELDERSSFFLEVIEREPPAKPLTGFGVEIAYPSRDGETTADLWLVGGSAYQPNDETWLDVQEYSPRDHAVRSEVLAAIYRLAYGPGGLGNAADYTLGLAWAAYFSRACAYRYLEEMGLERIGLRVGFAGGDWIDLRWVRPLQ